MGKTLRRRDCIRWGATPDWLRRADATFPLGWVSVPMARAVRELPFADALWALRAAPKMASEFALRTAARALIRAGDYESTPQAAIIAVHAAAVCCAAVTAHSESDRDRAIAARTAASAAAGAATAAADPDVWRDWGTERALQAAELAALFPAE